MYDIVSREKLETIITEIFSYIKKYKIEIPEDSCLVLEFRNSGRCGYYFVNHVERRLFWLDEFNGMDFLYEVKVKYTSSLVGEFLFITVAMSEFYLLTLKSRVGHEMKALYWLV